MGRSDVLVTLGSQGVASQNKSERRWEISPLHEAQCCCPLLKWEEGQKACSKLERQLVSVLRCFLR